LMSPSQILSKAPVASGDQLLKRTRSRCPVCHVSCPAEVLLQSGPVARVFLRRECPIHGEASVCIASDARFYWLARGKTQNADFRFPLAQGAFDSGPAECCSASGCGAGTLGRNAAARTGGPPRRHTRPPPRSALV